MDHDAWATSSAKLDVVEANFSRALGADRDRRDILQVHARVVLGEEAQRYPHALQLSLIRAAPAPPSTPLVWVGDGIELIASRRHQASAPSAILDVDEERDAGPGRRRTRDFLRGADGEIPVLADIPVRRRNVGRIGLRSRPG